MAARCDFLFRSVGLTQRQLARQVCVGIEFWAQLFASCEIAFREFDGGEFPRAKKTAEFAHR
jgi:hypothetical protein